MQAAPTIDLYDAIKEMRRLTSMNQSFSFVHATYDRERDQSNGFRHVTRATLRPAAKGEDQKDADHMLFYHDQEINQPRKCWQILLMWFNGKKCVLN